MTDKLLPLILLALTASTASAQEVRGHIDWQAHGSMHIPFKIYGKGLQEKSPQRTWRHQFKQTFHAPYLRRSGVRLMMSAAISAEKAKSRAEAWRLVREQLEFLEAFVAKNPTEFALARTPAAARRLLTQTNKIVFVHAVEGARLLVQSAADARYWARKGVALMTLIHLRDDELGGAAVNNGLLGRLVNMKGAWRKATKSKKRGLTAEGKQAIRWLHEAGILVDLTHMSQASIKDSLAITRAHGIPPIVTHGMFAPIKAGERSFSRAQVVEIYRQGGHFAIPLSGQAIDPKKPTIDLPAGFRKGTLDSFQLHLTELHETLIQNAGAILGRRVRCAADLSNAERTQLSLGWASDWNGAVNHSKPRWTKRERRRGETKEGLPLPTTLLEIDKVGLAHPGLLPQHWQRLREQGADLDPLLRSLERFLQLWAQVSR